MIKLFTLERELEGEGRRGMYVYMGTYTCIFYTTLGLVPSTTFINKTN